MNILHFIGPDLHSTEVKYVIAFFFGLLLPESEMTHQLKLLLLEKSAEYVKLLLLIPFHKFDRWTVMHWQESLVIHIK